MELEQHLRETFLEKFSWHIQETHPTKITEKSPIEKNNFRVEGHSETEIFIRELGQNAIDAKRESDANPVEIVIKEIEIDQRNQGLYKKIFSRKLQTLLEDSDDIEKAEEGRQGYETKYKAIVISDYGTKGLRSNEDRKESDWYKYWHVVGSQNKASKNNQLGSANQGKIAIWAFSSLWTVLGITKLKEGISRAQGKCVMSKFSDNPSNGMVRDCHSFFRKDDELGYDLTQDEIDQFNYLFQIKKREKFDYGSDFVLIESNDLDINELIVQIIRNWSIPIAENQIKFNIQNQTIDINNIYELINQYSESLSGLSADFIKFCIEARKKINKNKVYKLKRGLSYDKHFKGSMLNNALFEGDVTAKDLLKDFNEFNIIEIEFQPQIVYKETPAVPDRFSTFIKKINTEESDAESLGIMMRSYQILWKEQFKVDKPAHSREDLFLLTSADSRNINRLLTLFEEPTHLKFNGEQIDFKHKDVPFVKTPSIQTLSLFRKAASLSANFLNSSDIEPDEDFYSDWFSDSRGDNDKNPRNKKRKRRKKPIPPIPPAKFKPAIEMKQKDGTLILKSKEEYNYKEGQKIKIELAASLPNGCGNSFSNYTIFDFNLREMDPSYIEGCDITYAEFNQLEIQPVDNNFEMRIPGFWSEWGYEMKSEITKV